MTDMIEINSKLLKVEELASLVIIESHPLRQPISYQIMLVGIGIGIATNIGYGVRRLSNSCSDPGEYPTMQISSTV